MTPPYAAPEVWLGHAPTVASDIYSLGLTPMFAASARVPMAGSPPREDEVIEAFGSDVAQPLLQIDPRRRPRTPSPRRGSSAPTSRSTPSPAQPP